LWDNVLASYISFLKQSPLAKANAPEWYLEYSRILTLRRDDPVHGKISEMLKTKGDIVMSMYVDLERLTGALSPR
jgi:hypothetical protein